MLDTISLVGDADDGYRLSLRALGRGHVGTREMRMNLRKNPSRGFWRCASFASFILAATSCTDRVELGSTDRGTLMVGGNELRPPYEFVMSDSVLMVNGIVIRPYPEREPTAPIAVSPERLKSATEKFELMKTSREWAASQRRKGVADEVILSGLIERYLQSGLVDSAWTASKNLVVVWKDPRVEEYIPLPPANPAPEPSLKERRERELRYDAGSILGTLERDGIVILGSGYRMSAGGPRNHKLFLSDLMNLAKSDGRRLPEGLKRDLLHPDPIDPRKIAR